MQGSNDDGDMWLIFLIIFIVFLMAGSEDEKKEAPKAQFKVEYKYEKVADEEPKLVAPKVELGEVTEGGKVE